uniref:Isopentenyl diphosphate synthase-like protein n=1 Tax=Phyllotreta striolata TaxID=444603 RepID=A0A140AZ61_PHYSR|nr:isopentenyl diphosphate synthase-like protein [Phyllotreta striolata]
MSSMVYSRLLFVKRLPVFYQACKCYSNLAQPFIAVSQKIIADVDEIEDIEIYGNLKERTKNLLHHPRLIGDMESPNTTLKVFKILNPNEQKLDLVYLLGWLMEMLNGVLSIKSDSFHDIQTRNNTKSWHTDRTYNNQVSNDTVLMESYVFIQLKKYFSTHRNYVNILETFHEAFSDSLAGRNLELISKDLEKFDYNLLKNIAELKIAPMSFELPLKSALYLSNNSHIVYTEEIADVLKDIALLKKIKIDYLDSFGLLPEHFNIKHGYCSWLAIKSLEKVDGEQKAVLKEHYGKLELESIEKVNNVYKNSLLTADYEKLKEKIYDDTKAKIENISDELLRKSLFCILDRTYSLKADRM